MIANCIAERKKTAPRKKRGETFVTLTLVPVNDPRRWSAPPFRRLARLLKAALRGYGWRCVSMGGDVGGEDRGAGGTP
jgi:hypothetical protein